MMLIRRIKLRIKYYYKKIMLFSGICPICFTICNRDKHGRAICPNKLNH